MCNPHRLPHVLSLTVDAVSSCCTRRPQLMSIHKETDLFKSFRSFKLCVLSAPTTLSRSLGASKYPLYRLRKWSRSILDASLMDSRQQRLDLALNCKSKKSKRKMSGLYTEKNSRFTSQSTVHLIVALEHLNRQS